MKRRLIFGLSALLTSNLALANNDFTFSLSGGWPFLLNVEASYFTEDKNNRLYTSYRMGLDHGVAIGMERYVENTPHAFGVLVGAIGVKDQDDDCEPENRKSTDSVVEEVGTIFGSAIGCALGSVFDEETINGAALAYSYNFASSTAPGLSLRAELGYGKGHNSKEESATGGIYIRYQF